MTSIVLTEKAVKKVLDIAKESNLEPRIRVGVRGAGCSGYTHDLFFEEKDKIWDTDHVLEFNGVTLVVDMISATYLNGTTIDYVDGLGASGFKFDNDKHKETCGCGSSFRV